MGTDIFSMLDQLGLPIAAVRWKEVSSSPELSNFTPEQLLREVLTSQYIETMNDRYENTLQKSKLIDRSALVENLVTSDKRKYDDAIVQQVLSFQFVASQMNIGIYGVTDAGKTYFMSALCHEACRKLYRCIFLDYCALMDELLDLGRRKNLKTYRSRMTYYSRFPILFLDDFAISRYPEEAIKSLYQLIKSRTDLKNSTVFTCQYAPSEWGKQLSDDPGCFGKLDGLRRRLSKGYTVHIEKL